ncbi:hypothetical protein NKJ35_27430 [Mesorhizobium sp. M0136]|uniref:hypothetical protein n=1 Tax=Mesorhizobium sp. M0136 TaxID=2956890 RepID=UPI00333A5F31
MVGDFSNKDGGLRPVLEGKKPIGSLHTADNAGLGLGLAQAISVAELLEIAVAFSHVTLRQAM